MTPARTLLRHARSQAPVVFLSAALVASLGLTTVLSARSKEMRAELRRLRQRSVTAYVGMWAPPHRVATLAGDSVTIGRGNGASSQLLFYLSATCNLCSQTAPVWDSIARDLAVRDAKIDVRWVSVDSQAFARAWAAEYRTPEERVVLLEGEAPRRWYRALGVPQTVVFDSLGRVLFAHAGTLSGKPALVDSLRTLLTARRSTAVLPDASLP